jgi:hypothetical protein
MNYGEMISSREYDNQLYSNLQQTDSYKISISVEVLENIEFAIKSTFTPNSGQPKRDVSGGPICGLIGGGPKYVWGR